MIGNIPTSENRAEKFPNEREILNLYEKIIEGGFEILRSLEDEQGLYMLEVQATERDESGDIVQYNYMRAGRYPEGSASTTVIDVIYFMGDVPAGGHPVQKFEDGVWTKVGN